MDDIRWKQRFENLGKAKMQFQAALAAVSKEPDNKLYQMALIQGFEFTYELSWKTVKDFLNYNGIEVSLPRNVIKEGFAYGIIKDGDVWIKMLEDRNLMAHAYDEAHAKKAISHIRDNYAVAINVLFDVLKQKHDT